MNLEPTQITELNRAGIHGKIPGRIGNPGPACLACGLNTAADMVRTAGGAGSVILVTGEDKQLNLDEKNLEDMNVYTVGYSGLQLGAPATNLENIFILGESEEGVDVLANTFYQILQREELIDARFRFYSHELTASASDRVGGKFVVEEGLRNSLHVVATTSLKEDIENFELVSPSGKQFQFPVVEKGIIHFQFPGRAEPGVWSYSIKTVTAVSAEKISVTVSASAEAESLETTSALEVWTAGENPTVIYARVRFGSLPVFNASITASIKGPGAGNLALKLSDGGGGYPDLSPGDGIYSAYFTGVSAQPGFYSLSVQASDGSGAARVTEISSGFRIPTPSFTRYARASFHVARGAEYLIRDGIPQMDDIFPPARITNLRVRNYLSDSLEAGLSWTAPGGDFNVGSAAMYEIRCYTNRAALSQANFSVTGIPVPVVPTPGAAGSAQEANITVPWPNEVFYYAIVAIDASGNRGEVSNLVPVYVDEAPPAPDTSANAPLRSAPIFQHNDDNIIYIVSGSLTGLALIALCLGIAFICRTKRKEVMDKSDSLDYIKELGPSTLLPATKYGYTSETGTYSPSAATYSTVIGPYSTSTGPYSTSTGPYSTSTGPYPSETEAFSHETGNYSPETGTYSHESYRAGNYSPPRTSPSEYSTDSVFILGSKAPMYTTYQNLPAARAPEQNSESELSEASSRQWESTRTVESAWDSTQHNTWSSTQQYAVADAAVSAAGYSVSSEKKRRRKESFV